MFRVELITPDILERFHSKYRVCPETGCWIWTASVNSGGYGQLKNGMGDYKSGRAHVISYVIHRGNIPDNLCVLHRCDNRRCVNPEHLWLGTRRQNTDDMLAKGRWWHPSRKGTANGRSRLTEKQVIAIRDNFNESAKDLAKKYGVGKCTVDDIRERRTWRHLL